MSKKIDEALIKLGIKQQDVSEIIEHIPQIIINFEHNYSVSDLKKMFETLLYIHSAQYIREEGMWMAERNCPNKDIIELLLRFELLNSRKWNNLSVIKTTDVGEKISKAIIGKRIDDLRIIESIPEPVTEIIQDFQILPITYPNKSYVHNSQDFLLALPHYNERVYNLCKSFYIKAVKEGMAFITHYYVSTRGGKEREEYYILPPEIMEAVAEVIPKRLPKEVEQKIDEIKENMLALKFLYHYNPATYGGLGKYSQVEENIMTYLKELKESIDSSKDLFTSGFSNHMPYIIRDDDAYKTKILKFKKVLDKQISDLFSGVDVQKIQKKPSKKTEDKTPQPPKTPDTPPPPTELVPPISDLSILLGNTNNENVYWVPKKENSWNFIIVGSAGTGKTQTVRAILKDFDKNTLPYLIFDFREDYCIDNESQFGQVLDLESISINPLEIEGKNSPKDQKYQISDIIDLIYNIGPKQIGFIREAIKASYEEKGIYEDNKATWKKTPPTFSDIENCLNQKSEEGTMPVKNAIQGIFSRLDPIFDYDIFLPETTIKFEEIFKSNTIINWFSSASCG